MVANGKVSKFLREAGMCFLSFDADGEAGYLVMRRSFPIRGVPYFGVGRFEAAFRQIQRHPAVEITAMRGTEFLRFRGRAVFERDHDLAGYVLEQMPVLRRIYPMEGDEKLELFHLEDAEAVIQNEWGIVRFLEQ